MRRINLFLGKKGIVSEYLPWILISIALLVILMLTVFLLKGKGTEIIMNLKDLFRFR